MWIRGYLRGAVNASRLSQDVLYSTTDLRAVRKVLSLAAVVSSLRGSKEGPSSPKLEAYKTELGNFIVLLDKLETTFDALLAAYSHPSSLAQLQSLSEATGELSAGVKIMRQTLAERR